MQYRLWKKGSEFKNSLPFFHNLYCIFTSILNELPVDNHYTLLLCCNVLNCGIIK